MSRTTASRVRCSKYVMIYMGTPVKIALDH